MKISKKGVTLVEVMATLAVSTIVIIAVLLAIQAFSAQYASGAKRLDAKNAATLAGEYLENAIKYSQRAYIDNSDNALGFNVIESRDGRLYLKLQGTAEVPLMDEKSYNKLFCRAAFSKYDNNTVHAEILIFKSDSASSPLYTLKRDIRILNGFDDGREFGTVSDIVTIASGETQGRFLKFY